MPTKSKKFVTVEEFYTRFHGELQLRLIAGATGLKRPIRELTVNRPGMLLCGFNKYFASQRIQVIGNAEDTYLKLLSPAERAQRLRGLFGYKIPCVVFSRDRKPGKDFIQAAEDADVPLFETPLITMKFINHATIALDSLFAPTTSMMGSMVDVQGVGVVIRGESGIGKSESVLALLERGYCLVSDDVTRLRLLDGHEVMGSSPDLTRNHMEVRGIGIIDVGALFGVKAIRAEKRVDLLITLKHWEEVPDVDRIGADAQLETVLGIELPHITIPVRPGRDLARLIEVAAFNQKLKSAGRNTGREISARLLAQITQQAGL